MPAAIGRDQRGEEFFHITHNLVDSSPEPVMGSSNAGANALAKAVEERGYSCTANQPALREVCCI